MSQAILGQARTSILAADTSKFERHAPVQIGQLEDIDIFVTDEEPPKNISKICGAAKIRLEIAENFMTTEKAAE